LKIVVDARFGEDAVTYDLHDTEANKLSTAAGRTVVSGGSLSGDAWENVKRHGLLPAAGQVTPSHMSARWGTAPTYEPTEAMTRVANRMEMLARRLVGKTIRIGFINDSTASNAASHNPERSLLTLNVGRLGKRWFEPEDASGWERIDALMIHELAHERASDHLSEAYYDALCDFGAKLARIARDEPALFRDGRET
jgi:hypothetical protein